MILKEALDYLKTRGFITEDTETNDEEFINDTLPLEINNFKEEVG